MVSRSILLLSLALALLAGVLVGWAVSQAVDDDDTAEWTVRDARRAVLAYVVNAVGDEITPLLVGCLVAAARWDVTYLGDGVWEVVGEESEFSGPLGTWGVSERTGVVVPADMAAEQALAGLFEYVC